MNKSELITTQHLARKAIIYIRQSTLHQVLSNQESLQLQYALKDKAIKLGWRADDIEIVDCDLGITGASTQHREGFKQLIAKVTLGEVGIIFSSEVTRLSRNCSDFYPLLDICGWKGCLIADRDGIYDPSTPNGRMLLGLKGQLSELELYTIRSRMYAGLLNKAERGELALFLPTGLERDSLGRVEKDPNKEVQNRIELIFSTFLREKSANKVLRFLNHHQLLIPRRSKFGDVVWRKPSVAAIILFLKNPAYAGAFVYGKTRMTAKVSSTNNKIQRKLPIEEWKIRINDKYPAYISWQTFEKIQAMLKDNYAEYDRNKTRGVPRQGKALLHGLVYCGECGHKMMVQYKHSTQYLCNALRQQYGVRVCQNIQADPIDKAVVEAFFQALSPIELDSYSQALLAKQQTDEQITKARCQEIERLRFQVALAERQFNRVDPDNRLVASELEQRWETALRQLKQAESLHNKFQEQSSQPFLLSAELKEKFGSIGEKLPQLWQEQILSQQQKKALLRAIIDKIVIHRLAPDQIQTRIVWKGGLTTTLKVAVSVGSFERLSFFKEMEELILQLTAEEKTDQEIAQYLTDQGFRSPMKDYVLENTVRSVRLKHGVFRKATQSHPRRIAGFLTVTQIAKALSIPKHWLHDRIHNGTISVAKDPVTGLWLFPNNATTLQMFRDLWSGNLHNLHFS